MKEVFLGTIAALLYKLVACTWRYHYFREDNDGNFSSITKKEALKRGFQANLFAFWHQDEISLLNSFAGEKFLAMVSKSKDGTIMATALKILGHDTIRGSSHRGGAAALISAIKQVREGKKLVMAVDGPRGPIFQAKDGITLIARKLEQPIISFRANPHRAHVFTRSWNQARIPYPFSRIDVKIGLPKKIEKAEELTQILNAL